MNRPSLRRVVQRGLLIALPVLVACDDDDPVGPVELPSPAVEIEIASGALGSTCNLAAPGEQIRWSARPESDRVSPTAEIRTLVLEVGGPDIPCLTEVEYAGLGLIDPQDAAWSAWESYEPTNRASRSLTLPNATLGTSLLVVVQARDAEGRVDPRFDWNRNVVHIRLSVEALNASARPQVAFDLTRFPIRTSCSEATPGTILRWEALPSSESVSPTVEVRTLVQRVGGADEPCFNDIDFQVERPIDPENSRWSPWIAYDAPDGSGRQLAVPDLPAGINLLISVQARDARGQADSDFRWYGNVLNLRMVDAP